MANNIARSFLNDTSVILLDSSEGARNVVKKQQELREFEQKGIDKRVELELLFKKSSDNNKAICDLRGIGFFGRLFKKKEIEAEFNKRLENVDLEHKKQVEVLTAEFEERFNNQRIKYEKKLMAMENQISDLEVKYTESQKSFFTKMIERCKKR